MKIDSKFTENCEAELTEWLLPCIKLNIMITMTATRYPGA